MKTLSNREKEWLEETKTLTNEIKKIYENLYKEEISNRKNKKIYKENLELLKTLIGIELNQYSKDRITEQELSNILEKVKEDDSIQKRMLKQIKEKAENYKYLTQVEELTDEDRALFAMIGYDSDIEIYNLIQNNIYLKRNLTKILSEEQKLLSLYYLDQESKQKKSDKVTKYITKTKYKYCDEDLLDRRLLSSTFTIEEPDLVSIKEISSLLKRNEFEVITTKEEILQRKIESLIIAILDTPDYYYDEIEPHLLMLRLNSLLKAAISLSEQETKQIAYHETLRFLNSKTYHQNHNTNNISKSLVLNTIKEEIKETVKQTKQFSKTLN